MLWGSISYNLYYIWLFIFRARLLGHMTEYYIWRSRIIMRVLTRNYDVETPANIMGSYKVFVAGER
jgi:hypothetical protein